jgi:hypothetical protein
MRALYALAPIVLLVVASAGCGTEIGDECTVSRDCSADGDRTCDVTSPDGYCTVVGCDYGTCPREAVCVRFFSGTSVNLPCDPDTEGDTTFDCTSDELCTLGGTCAPRNAELRFCMRTCRDASDCRDGYECRDRELMVAHGGEPVPPPGERQSSEPQGFCAVAPAD